jgi:hypothetical protein
MQNLAKRLSMTAVIQEVEGDNLDLDNVERAIVAKGRARSSTPEEWKKQGELFFDRGLFDAATIAFGKSGHTAQEHQAKGHLLLSQLQSATEIDLIRDAGYHLLYGNSPVMRDFDDLVLAMDCFYQSKEIDSAIGIAARLGGDHLRKAGDKMRHLGMHSQAAKLYEIQSDFMEAAICWEKCQNQGKAIAALEQAPESPQRSHKILRLCRSQADTHYAAGDLEKMSAVVCKFPKLADQIQYLDKHNLRDLCVTFLIRNKKYSEAALKVMGTAEHSKIKHPKFCQAAEVLQQSEDSEDQLDRARYLLAEFAERKRIDLGGNPASLRECHQIFKSQTGCDSELAVTQLLLGSIEKNVSLVAESYDTFLGQASLCGQVKVLAAVLDLKIESEFVNEHPLSGDLVEDKRKRSRREADKCREVDLFQAIMREDVTAIRNLLDTGTNIMARNSGGETPMEMAKSRRKGTARKCLEVYAQKQDVVDGGEEAPDTTAYTRVALHLIELCAELMRSDSALDDPFLQLQQSGLTLFVDVLNVTFRSLLQYHNVTLNKTKSGETGRYGDKVSATDARVCIKHWCSMLVLPQLKKLLQMKADLMEKQQARPAIQWKLEVCLRVETRWVNWHQKPGQHRWKLFPYQNTEVQLTPEAICDAQLSGAKSICIQMGLVWKGLEFAKSHRDRVTLTKEFTKRLAAMVYQLCGVVLEMALGSPLVDTARTLAVQFQISLSVPGLQDTVMQQIFNWSKKTSTSELDVLKAFQLREAIGMDGDRKYFIRLLRQLESKKWCLKDTTERVDRPIAELLSRPDPQFSLDYLMHQCSAGIVFSMNHLALLEDAGAASR